MLLLSSEFTVALTSIKNLYELAKNANDVQLGMKINAELATIQGKLIEVQQQTLHLQRENYRLQTEMERSKSYHPHHSVTWKVRPDGSEDGPFCSACIGDGIEMRLTLVPRYNTERDYWMVYCPKGHVKKGDQFKSMSPKEEPMYKIPKNLVPDDYFSIS